MSLTRVQAFSISLDGFATGEGLSRDEPFGHAGDRLHDWMVATRWGGEMFGRSGGTGGVDDAFLRLFAPEVGAEIMGAGKFGPPGWHEDPEWKGWWGPNPPFHTPVFVLTHHPRPSFSLADTTFHFIDASPADALAQAKAAADGKDVRCGGGVHTVREFLDADLVDTLHVAVAPIDLGRGERLWDSPDELLDRYHCDRVPSPSGVTHLLYWRR